MPTFRSFAEFGRALDKLDIEIRSAERRKITRDMAEEGQRISYQAATRDVGGDRKFSGWAPTLDLRIKTVRGGDHILMPTRTSAGPWTVAEFGRNAGGGAGGFQGPGVNLRTGRTRRRRDGTVSTRRRRVTVRWNGVTQGKSTASDATREMNKKLPGVAAKGVRAALKKRFDVT